jgi:carbonic anhydrase/acetyltransferase-like protein (isoleucine patch superfamily)
MNLRSFQGIEPTLGKKVFIDPSAVVIGDVSLADDVSVWPNVVIRGDVQSISVGAATSVQDGSVLHVTHRGGGNPDGLALIIGSQVTIGHLAMLHGCTVGDQVLIGMGSMVMDGAIIESQVVLGAGSLVPPGKTLVSGYLYVGRPAKQVRALTEKELNFFNYTANNYVNWKNQYLQEEWAK